MAFKGPDKALKGLIRPSRALEDFKGILHVYALEGIIKGPIKNHGFKTLFLMWFQNPIFS